MRRVLRFLDADDEPPIRLVNTNVTTRTQRSVRARYLLDSLLKSRSPIARSTRRTLRRVTTQRIRRGSVPVFREHVVNAAARPPDESVTLELRERFKPEVVALSEYLGRDLLSLWGYDRVL